MGEVKNKDGSIVGYFHDSKGHEECYSAYNVNTNSPSPIKPPSTDERSKVPPTTPKVPPTTPQELTEFALDFFYECMQISKEKNARYAGAIDPFKNFRLGGTYGIVIRMTDKVSRLLTLLDPTNKVDSADETIEDTCKDLANYAMLLSGLRENERAKG